MRLLVLKEALPTGGAERQLALLVKHLPPYWERRVWLMGDGPFADALLADGYRVDVFPRRRRYDVRPAASLWRTLIEWRPDVVHSWDWMSTLAAVPVCRMLRIPIVDSTIRNGTVRPRGALQRRLSHTLSTLVVANSQAGLQAWGVRLGKGRVVYNAFDPQRLPETGDGNTRAVGNGGPRTVVMTGRMVADKDFSTVIAAADRLERERPGGWRFVFLGDGPERRRLMEEAAGLSDRGVVTFVDPGLDVLPFVRQADVGVLMADEARNREGCSNAIMEYMSCGLPVVCSDGGGNPELVLEGETGHVVPPCDPVALVTALVRLAEDPETARRLGEAGRRRILEEFTVERMVRDMDRIYWEALS